MGNVLQGSSVSGSLELSPNAQRTQQGSKGLHPIKTEDDQGDTSTDSLVTTMNVNGNGGTTDHHGRGIQTENRINSAPPPPATLVTEPKWLSQPYSQLPLLPQADTARWMTSN